MNSEHSFQEHLLDLVNLFEMRELQERIGNDGLTSFRIVLRAVSMEVRCRLIGIQSLLGLSFSLPSDVGINSVMVVG